MRQDLSLRLEQFKKQYVADEAVRSRIAEPPVKFIGDEIMELAVAALLQGENVLLSGGKATGKNILADNLAWLFARPVYTVSFHVNTDSSTLIGTDTFTGGEVRLRRGPVALAAQYGGFCILDEINMAKNDAVAVLHSALDYRRLIDVPGYECIPIHPAARFIATMNYGYAGTRFENFFDSPLQKLARLTERKWHHIIYRTYVLDDAAGRKLNVFCLRGRGDRLS